MKLAKLLEELSASISLIIIDGSDTIWKQNLSGELHEYDKDQLSVLFGVSQDVTNIQRMLYEMTNEILSPTIITFDVKRHLNVSKMLEPYDNLFRDKKQVNILLHGAAHVSYCVCNRIMDEFNENTPYNKEVKIFLKNLKDLLYLLGRVINIFRIYREPKYLY